MVGTLLILGCSNLQYIQHSEESVVPFPGLQLSLFGVGYMCCVISVSFISGATMVVICM